MERKTKEGEEDDREGNDVGGRPEVTTVLEGGGVENALKTRVGAIR